MYSKQVMDVITFRWPIARYVLKLGIRLPETRARCDTIVSEITHFL